MFLQQKKKGALAGALQLYVKMAAENYGMKLTASADALLVLLAR